MSSKFAKNIRGNYSGIDQGVGPATIWRRNGSRIIPSEKLADPSKQTGVILGNLKKITRSTLRTNLKKLSPSKLKKVSKEGHAVILLCSQGKTYGQLKCQRGFF